MSLRDEIVQNQATKAKSKQQSAGQEAKIIDEKAIVAEIKKKEKAFVAQVKQGIVPSEWEQMYNEICKRIKAFYDRIQDTKFCVQLEMDLETLRKFTSRNLTYYSDGNLLCKYIKMRLKAEGFKRVSCSIFDATKSSYVDSSVLQTRYDTEYYSEMSNYYAHGGWGAPPKRKIAPASSPSKTKATYAGSLSVKGRI